ncbi:O-antigen ligase family protein [Mycolicibacterium austroafricanum]|uniref:O-antigen ligase family protein n=1 Tax=Mycolicibacterium austroafricanum TaxID=39687 RepID=UPI001ABF2859|nr:O-antigen ligase family protein [Mycolicibacterium austroafricanum]QRZ08336.1 O-antigen ligase family protein [Mycolicibacterium austroafricanum]QZT69989.1 O-antigen ligase family protein [Mycolicibacterium austroafricanum]
MPEQAAMLTSNANAKGMVASLADSHIARRAMPSGVIASSLVAALVAMPIANSAAVVRRATGSAYPSVITFLVPLFVAILTLSIIAIIAEASNEPIGASQTSRESAGRAGAGLFAALLAWLLITYFRVGEFDAVRNLAVVIIAFTVVYTFAKRGLALGELYRSLCRITVFVSLALYVLNSTWFVNAHKYFIDSGKIVSTFPNVQGILSHPNLTALFYGSALITEVALWGKGRAHVSLFYAFAFSSLLAVTQGRNAIGATVLAVLCVVAYKKGRAAIAAATLTACFAASWVPLAWMVPSFFTTDRPDYGWLSGVTNRGSLWVAIAEILPDSIIWGNGANGIRQALPLTMDRDVDEVTHAHNQILDLLLVGGLPAVGLYTLLFFVIAKHIRSGRPSPVGVGLIILLAVTTITETPLAPYVTQIGVVLFSLTITLIFAQPGASIAPSHTSPTNRPVHPTPSTLPADHISAKQWTSR